MPRRPSARPRPWRHIEHSFELSARLHDTHNRTLSRSQAQGRASKTLPRHRITSPLSVVCHCRVLCSCLPSPDDRGWGQSPAHHAKEENRHTHAPGSSSPATAPPPADPCPGPSPFFFPPPDSPPPASRCLLPVVAISGSGCVDALQKQRPEPASITGWGPRIT